MYGVMTFRCKANTANSVKVDINNSQMANIQYA